MTDEEFLKAAKPGTRFYYSPEQASAMMRAYENGLVLLFSERKEDWQPRCTRYAVRVSPRAYAWVGRVSKSINHRMKVAGLGIGHPSLRDQNY